MPVTPNTGGRGEALLPERAGRGAVSRLEGLRRGLANPLQGALFSDRLAYESYVAYCYRIGLHSPPDFDAWKHNSRILFGANRLSLPNS